MADKCCFCGREDGDHLSKDCKWKPFGAFREYVEKERSELPESSLPFALEMFNEGWKAAVGYMTSGE